MKPTILVVDDEQDLRDLVQFNLERGGYAVLTSQDGLEALKLAKEKKPDLILLDLMLPGMDGKEVCRSLKQDESIRSIPVIMLTAKAEEIDRIIGFELGADDYITKPFNPRELVLRISAVLKRTKAPDTPVATLTSPGLEIDLERHKVLVDEQEIELTAMEFNLLTHLVSRRGRVQTREMLLEQVWGLYEGYARTVDVHIRRLRQKLGPLKDHLETIRGFGYRFREKP
ncbi:MAG: response regulator [Deltaproteobacteria bacterium]|nr:response regulator [Deltaproteobacteria bacterium]